MIIIIKSILAGAMIAVGAIVNLQVGGLLGPFLFAVGLLTVLEFELSLFTGKAGLLATKEIDMATLFYIWVGNFLGTALIAGLLLFVPMSYGLSETSSAILTTRITNGIPANFVLGIFCGLLMYIAVTTYRWTGNPIMAIIPVAVFILSGYNHCVADMFYSHLATTGVKDYLHLIPTTLGNIVGCSAIPWALKIAKH